MPRRLQAPSASGTPRLPKRLLRLPGARPRAPAGSLSRSRKPPKGPRATTPDEMALIWFYIGWDITEPVFTVEQAGRPLVVDFDEMGQSVVWIEGHPAALFPSSIGRRWSQGVLLQQDRSRREQVWSRV